MVDAALLREELRAELPAMLAATERLAAIDSGSYDAAGVDRVADGYAELLAARGFAIERTPLAERGHRLAARRELGDGPTLLLVGHADTVWPAGTVADWPTTRDDALLRGPGVGDMKGCVVMAIHALAAALRHGAGEGGGLGAIELLVVPDEELGSPGSRAWIEARARAAGACLGLEAGWPGGGIVVSRGAVGALYVTATGRSAHCAAHEDEDEGASAVAALAPLVAELEACSRPEEGVRVSVGVFRGGSARQVVPDAAELHVDLRAPDAAAADALLGRVRACVDARADSGVRTDAGGDAGGGADAGAGADARGGADGRPGARADARAGAAAGGDTGGRAGVTLALRGGFTRPAFTREASAPLWRLAAERARELGIALEPVHARGGSDASFAGALGIPTLDGLGPICHDSCARGERIEIASLAYRGALLAGLVLDLAEQWRTNPANSNWQSDILP